MSENIVLQWRDQADPYAVRTPASIIGPPGLPGLSGTAVLGSLKYVTNSADPDNSLGFLEGVQLGDSYSCRHWSVDQQDGSFSVWRCVKTDRSDDEQSVVADSLYGLLFIGAGDAGSRPGWAMTPLVSNIIDIRSWGVKCDGVIHDHHTLMNKLFTAAKVRGWKLTGGGVLKIGETIDGRGANFDFTNMRLQIGTNVTATTVPGLEGDFCPFYQKKVGSISAGTPGTINITAHGFVPGVNQTTVQVDVFAPVGTIPAGLSAATTYHVVNATTDSFQLALTEGGSPIAITSTGSGNIYIARHFANIVVEDREVWPLGEYQRYGIGIRAGGQASLRERLEQKLYVWGDGNFDFTTVSRCMQIRWEDSAGSHVHLEGDVTYGGIPHGIYGQLEKHSCDFRAYYSDWLGYAQSTSNSSDTVEIKWRGGQCRHWVWESDGSDTSMHHIFYCESRVNPGDGSPDTFIRNGKYTKISGQHRAGSGELGMLVDKSSNVGVDTLHFDNFDKIHGYGLALWLKRIRNYGGTAEFKDADDGPSSGAPDSNPVVRIDRAGMGGHFHCSILASKAREALRIGNVAENLYGYDTHYGHFTIHCGVDFQFNSDGTEKVAGFPTSISGSSPSITAVVIEKAKGGQIVIDQCDGLIAIGAGVLASETGKFKVVTPRQNKRYANTNAVPSQAEFQDDYGRPNYQVSAITSAASLTPNFNLFDVFDVTAQAQALSIANPTWSIPVDAARLMIRIKDNGSSRALTWGSAYASGGLALPAATTAGKMMHLGFIYFASTDKWILLASTVEP
jgi:hypothetical protein